MLVFFLTAFVAGIVILPFWLILAKPFPLPSGKWPVGTTELTWNSTSHIGIIAKVWYPTNDSTGVNSPYIDNIGRTLSVMTTDLNPLIKLIFNRLYLGRVMTPAFFNATLDQSSTAFPLILFSPGFGGVNWINTFYLLEFASHGFIVIGINHPGTSAVTLLTNGSQVKFNTIEKDVFTDADLFDASLAKISSQQASNISILVDTAIELNSDENSFLYQKINTSKIFAVGHSIGGAASFIACGQDQHISKAVNFDGAFVDGINTDYTGKELLLINSDRDKFRPKNRTMRSQYDEIMHRDKLRIDQLEVKANLQRMMLPLTGHLNFADVALIIRPAFTQLIGLIGKINGLDLLRKTAAISMDFFDR